MAASITINFDTGAEGDAVSSGADGVSAVVGTPVKTKDSRTGFGLAMLCAGLASTLARTDWGANPVTHTVSIEVKPRIIQANTYFLRWGDTSNAIIASVRFGTSSGKIELTDSGNTVRATSTTSYAAYSWYRIEADYDATVPLMPAVAVRIFTVFGTNPVETISFTFATAFTFGRLQYGAIGTQGSGSREIVIDSLQIGYGLQRLGPLVEVRVSPFPSFARTVSRTWSPLPAWAPTSSGGIRVWTPGLTTINAVRVWSPLATWSRSSAGVTVLAGSQRRVEQVKPADGWGVRL